MDKAAQFLAAERKSGPPALQPFYTRAEQLYDKKLWHELTRLVLDDLLAKPEAKARLHSIYVNFVSHWAQKMKSFSRVQVWLLSIYFINYRAWPYSTAL